MSKYQFICIHDNVVTDEPDITRIEAYSLAEADDIAYEQSKQSWRSVGNYELYVNTMFVKLDGLTMEYVGGQE